LIAVRFLSYVTREGEIVDVEPETLTRPAGHEAEVQNIFEVEARHVREQLNVYEL